MKNIVWVPITFSKMRFSACAFLPAKSRKIILKNSEIDILCEIASKTGIKLNLLKTSRSSIKQFYPSYDAAMNLFKEIKFKKIFLVC